MGEELLYYEIIEINIGGVMDMKKCVDNKVVFFNKALGYPDRLK